MSRRTAIPALLATAAAAVLALAGCTEKLTTPADCPDLCPGGAAKTIDTLIFADSARTFPTDTSGYRPRTFGLRASNGLDASDDRGVLRFIARGDSVLVSDTLRGIASIDSVALTLPLLGRDTTATGVSLVLYRLPNTVDATWTFAQVEAELTEANRIADIPIPDTLRSGALKKVFRADSLTPLVTADSLAIAIAVQSASGPTGVRLGAIAASSPPSWVTYVHAAVTDTAKQVQSIARGPVLTTFVSRTPPVVPPNALVVGDAPSKRTLLEFSLPLQLRDTASIVRATLELTPAAPIPGLPGDPAALNAFGVITDVGAKSPLDLTIGTTPITPGTTLLTVGSQDTLRLDVTTQVRRWRGAFRPQALFLTLAPEGSSFTRAYLAGMETGAARPRLRITYVLPFPFEAP